MTQESEQELPPPPKICCVTGKGFRCSLRPYAGKIAKAIALVLVIGGLYVGFAFLSAVKKPPSPEVIEKIRQSFQTRTMYVLKTNPAGRIPLELEVATNAEEQALGLMFRDEVPEGTGMLFVSVPARKVTFWMKNTKVSLDMIFVRMDGQIVKIHPNAKPYDLTPISSDVPVTGVIEIAGGEAERLGIKVGDYVQ